MALMKEMALVRARAKAKDPYSAIPDPYSAIPGAAAACVAFASAHLMVALLTQRAPVEAAAEDPGKKNIRLENTYHHFRSRCDPACWDL